MKKLPKPLDSELRRLPLILESKLVPNLFDDPGKEDKGSTNFEGVKLDTVEEPVRVEALSLHLTSKLILGQALFLQENSHSAFRELAS